MAKQNAAESDSSKESPKVSKFASQVKKGKNPNPKIERGCILPKNLSKDGCFIIPEQDLINCGWYDKNPKLEPHSLGGEIIQALHLRTMNVCVIKSTHPYSESREKDENGKREFLGIINRETYVHNKEIAIYNENFLLLLLDDNYKPLHRRGLHLKAHGNAGYSFGTAWTGSAERKGFYEELQDSMRKSWDAAGVDYDELDVFKTTFSNIDEPEPWHNCSVMKLKFKAETRGKPGTQALCCLVDDWEHPTPENCEEFWRDELKGIIREMAAEAIGSGWGRTKGLLAAEPTQFAILPYEDEVYPPNLDEETRLKLASPTLEVANGAPPY